MSEENKDIPENEKRALAIVERILQVFAEERLTVRDAERIMLAMPHILGNVTIPVSVPQVLHWPKLRNLPSFLE